MNENEKAIKGVFGNKKQFKKLMMDVLDYMEDDFDEDATFSEFISQFFHDFDRFASECALEALGIDLECFYIRHNGEVNRDVVQEIIDGTTYRNLDSDVHQLFEILCTGDTPKAYALFQHIFASQQIDQPDLVEAELEEYLIQVNKYSEFAEFGDWTSVITNFKKVAGSHQLKGELESKLTVTSKQKAPKI